MKNNDNGDFSYVSKELYVLFPKLSKAGLKLLSIAALLIEEDCNEVYLEPNVVMSSRSFYNAVSELKEYNILRQTSKSSRIYELNPDLIRKGTLEQHQKRKESEKQKEEFIKNFYDYDPSRINNS